MFFSFANDIWVIYIYVNNNVDVYVSIYLCDISPGKLMPKVVSTPSQTPRSGLGAQGA